jgi:hypothetical protein
LFFLFTHKFSELFPDRGNQEISLRERPKQLEDYDMHAQNEKVRISKKALSNLVTDHYEVLERYRALQIQCGIAVETSVPKRKHLKKLDTAVGEVLSSLLEGEEQLDNAMEKYEPVRREIMRLVMESMPKRQERIQRRDLPGAIPKTSRRLFEAIGKQGISNAKSLSGELKVAKGTISKQVAPLLLLDIVKRQTSAPLTGRRNWEYVYQLGTRGLYAYIDTFHVKPKEYDYRKGSERFQHHLATNLIAYTFRDFQPVGFYFGHESDCVKQDSTYGIKSSLISDTAGWLGNRMTYIEVEFSNDFFSFTKKFKKVFLSKVENLLLVVKGKLFVSEYAAIANNTHVDGKLMSEDPLRVYLITLQDFVDGHEPELIAERSRRPSLGQII